MMKRIIIGTIAGLLLALFLPLVTNGKLSLLSFINSSFYIVGAILTLSLLLLVIQKGFFDVTFMSFQKLGRSQDEKGDIRKLSEIITLPYVHFFIMGLILCIIMLGSLYFYYR